MAPKQVSHVGFADESHWNHGRFRSIALVTCTVDTHRALAVEVRQLLDESSVSEFKWKNLKGARERLAAQKLCRLVVEKAYGGLLRVDVLIWDTTDSRHKQVPLPDHAANLGRMYYHLLGQVLEKRWPNEASWLIHPDEHGEMDWSTLQEFLTHRSLSVIPPNLLNPGNRFRFEFRSVYDLGDIAPIDSKMHPLAQVADLFAGMSVFSREHFSDFSEWQKSQNGQMNFGCCGDEGAGGKLSRSDRERFPVLDTFNQDCKRRSIGVSLDKTKGLKTFQPKNPLNFWLYEPQHLSDRAPSREVH